MTWRPTWPRKSNRRRCGLCTGFQQL